MRDIVHDAGAERQFECFHCGRTVTAVTNPHRCPDCGESMRNRGTPLE